MLNTHQVSTSPGYREFLHERLAARRAGGRGVLAELARAARVHPTMITHIFKGDAQLSPEQALRIATYLKLDEHDTGRLLDMVMHDRAGTEEARRFFRRRLEKGNEHMGARFRLFHNWLPAALMLLLPDEGGLSAGELAGQSRASEEKVREAIALLEAHGYCRQDGGLVVKCEALRPADASEAELSRRAWRARAGAEPPQAGFAVAMPVLCSEEKAQELRRFVEKWLSEAGEDQRGALRVVEVILERL